mmetsp:Transcript_13065/g.14956  ORF Transcript_13065/g.14956 Transcript_13065/m.14956 type:complete len:98 (+) Transcript_13065:49-342(+)|eukprot:CAMPEP_0194135590 /NCGR_PEP_ID=MMETSP0152-20130528/5688_1 /TAXON_ID=1049557 /ORGANISM="Thalassiothrix antarctica, Strain L6-D1" /LENGTH=97 /DNA_ID=CAMNT_0038831905 /DNA_START=47 /DNA_END=340 /DNA_ORIENTATION=-
MIIDAKAIVVTLLIVAVAFLTGLRMVRSFALSIAQENHDANVALDQAEEQKRVKQERNADVAAASAFAKVEPLLTVTTSKTATSLPKPEVGTTNPEV